MSKTFTVQSRGRIHHFEQVTEGSAERLRKVIGPHVWHWCKVTRTPTDPYNNYGTRIDFDWLLAGNLT